MENDDLRKPEMKVNKKYSDWAEENPNYLIITKAGYFYMAWGRSAEVLNEVLDYNLAYTKKGVAYTGGTSLEIIGNALETNHLNYIVIERGEITCKREFEYCDEIFYRPEDFAGSKKSTIYDGITDEEKLQAIDALLNKVDPATGEILDESHLVYEDVVQAILLTAQKAIQRKQEREKKKKESAGAKWTSEEDAQLIEEYRKHLPIQEIAEIHKRSAGAIQSRIVKLWQNMQTEEKYI